MKIRGKRVFLSGPMTGFENHNVAAFAEAHALLKIAGAKYVYNPAIAYLNCESMYMKRSHGFFMRRCLHELTSVGLGDERPIYDFLVSLPGWQDSLGARTERTVAESCEIPCFELGEVLGDG